MPNKLTWKDKYEKAMHFIDCARINLDTLAKQNPPLKSHPIFMVAEQQLKWSQEDAQQDPKGRRSENNQ
jgi:hypothetical protein